MVSWTWGQQKNVCIFITYYLVCAPPLFLTHFFSDSNEICKATTHSHLLIYSLHINHLWLFIGLKLKILSKHFRDYTSQMCSLCCLRDFFFSKTHVLFVLLCLFCLFTWAVSILSESYFLCYGNSLSGFFCCPFYFFVITASTCGSVGAGWRTCLVGINCLCITTQRLQ